MYAFWGIVWSRSKLTGNGASNSETRKYLKYWVRIFTRRGRLGVTYTKAKKVTWIQESRFQECYIGCTHSGKMSDAAEATLLYPKEQRIFKPISTSRPHFLDFGNVGYIVKDLGTDPCK